MTTVIANTDFLANVQLVIIHIGTIHRTFVATAKDVTVALQHTFVGTNLAAMDVDTSLTEDIALTEQAIRFQRLHHILIHIHGTIATPAVLTTTATEDVAQYLTTVHGNLRCASPEYSGITVL